MTVYEESLRAILASTEVSLERARDALDPMSKIAVLEHQVVFIKGLLAEARALN